MLSGVEFSFREMPIGGAALDLVGVPLPEETISVAKESDVVLLGAPLEGLSSPLQFFYFHVLISLEYSVSSCWYNFRYK